MRKALSMLLAIVMVFTMSAIILATEVGDVDEIIEEVIDEINVADESLVDEEAIIEDEILETPEFIEVERDWEQMPIENNISFEQMLLENNATPLIMHEGASAPTATREFAIALSEKLSESFLL